MFELPDNILHFISDFLFVLSTITFWHLGFYSILSLYGLKRPKRDYQIHPDEKTFLFVIPAHNEAAVIESCVASIQAIKYDKTKYSTVVLADNCSDNTAEIAETFGNVSVFENSYGEGESRGKPQVIGKYLKKFSDYWESFDYIVLIDADNLVSENFLTEINSQFLEKPELTVIQGYLDTKNVTDSILSRGYAAAYYITNRAIQYSKHRLAWNAAIGGTGFAMSTRYLKKRGWRPKSYTEDFEIQVDLSIEGKTSTWNHFAKVYDEKPNSINVSHTQRTRWSQGHWFIAISKTGKQIRSFFKSETPIQLFNRIETLVYSYSMLRAIWLFCIFLAICIDSRFIDKIPFLFSTFYFWLVFEILNYLVLPIVYILQEGKEFFYKLTTINKLKEFCLLWVGFFFSTLIYNFAQIQGFFTWYFPQNNWKKTDHTRNMTNKDLM
ncbi:glycosyltransferase family 2 protein [Enterococcus faecium]|nr:glycosyltransferase family 2 protein [Enterococcus faecium]